MTVAIRKLQVPRHQRLISQGQVVSIIAEIADVGQVSVLIDTAHVPLLSLFDPQNALVLSNGDMVRLSTGLYEYAYQTSALNAVGVYSATIIARDSVTAARLERVVVFKIIDLALTPFPLDTFSYFAIKDQEGNVWYWYIAEDDTVNFSASVPSILEKIAQEVIIDPVPYWLELMNGNDELRYVYPFITGEYAVSATVPSVGSGHVGSPELKSVSGSMFTIALNSIDEVIVHEEAV